MYSVTIFLYQLVYSSISATKTLTHVELCDRTKDLPPCSKDKLKQGEIVQAQKGTLVYTKWHDKKDISFLSTNVLPMEEGRQVERTVRGQKTHITKP